MAFDTNPERDRGILTPADRKFLLGEKELEGNAKRQARQRIRERLKNAVMDFTILRWGLCEEDRDLFARELFSGRSKLWEGYEDMYALFYILNREHGYQLGSELRNAVQSAEDQLQRDTGETVDVNLTFSVEKEVIHDHSELQRKFEEQQPMSPDEMQTLLFNSTYFDHLREESKWELFGEFLEGELENECEIESGEGPTPV